MAHLLVVSGMTTQTTALDWPRTFFIDGRGETILPGQLASASPVWTQGDDGPGDAALERGFIQIWRCGRDVLIFLQPDRVNCVTVAGAVDVLARLGQDWTIVCPTGPGERVEWFRSCTAAIRKITTLLQKAGQLPPCPGYENILVAASRLQGSQSQLAEKYRDEENVILFRRK